MKNNLISNIYTNKILILIWILFTSVEPFQFYAVVPYHPYKIIVFFLTFYFLFVILSKKVKLNIDLFVLVLLIQMVFTFITIGIHYLSINEFIFDDGIIYFNLFLQLIVNLLLYIYVKNFYSFKSLSFSVVKVMSYMAILGTIGIVLIYTFSITPFSYTVREGNRDISNFLFTFATGKIEDNFLAIIRSAGYFDEPGTFAFYIIIAILLNKLYGFSKKYEYILMIFGFCTLSLAFFISIFFYIILFSVIEKRIIFLSFLLTILSSIFILIVSLKNEDPLFQQLYELTIYRLESDGTTDGQQFNGDNRSENIKYAYKAFLNAPFFGYGMNAHVNSKIEYYGKLCCNPLHPLATEGIFGTIIYFLLFFAWFFTLFKFGYFDFVSFAAWLIVLLNLFQRPGFSNGPFGYFIYILLINATIRRKELNYSLKITKNNKIDK